MYKRILLKLSGEALSNTREIYSLPILEKIATVVKDVTNQGVKTAIVVGGGNIVRGRKLAELGFDRVSADYLGMLGTVMNALALSSVLKKAGLKVKTLSALRVQGVDFYKPQVAKELYDAGYVIVFAGGIATPYFSTDTTCAVRAAELGAEIVLLAKNGVDGVYDADPRLNPLAKKYETLTYNEILTKRLLVIDQTAAALLNDRQISALVFDMQEITNLNKAIRGEKIGTTVTV